MDHHSVNLQIPFSIYERVRQIAKNSDRPIESILLDSLVLLFGELPAVDELTPQRMATFTDEQLWAIVHHDLAWPQDARLRELTALGKSGQLTDLELTEIDMLIDRVDRTVFLRSQALLLLKQRGHDVEQRLKLGA